MKISLFNKFSYLLILYLIPSILLCQKSTADEFDAAEQLYTESKEAFDDGDYLRASFLMQEAIERYRANGDTLREDFVRCYHKLGDIYASLRQHEKALHWYGVSEKSYQRIVDKENTVFADILLDRGSVYSQMYEPNKAIAAFDSALLIYEGIYGPVSDRAANIHMNIGIDLIKSGQFRIAEEKMLKAKKIFEQTSDSLSINSNRIYSNIGYLYRKMGDYPRALEYGRIALKIKLHNYDTSHPSVGKYYRNIGKSLVELGRIKEAIPYYEKGLENQLQSRGENHPETAGSYGELSNILRKAKEYSRAKVLQQKANDIQSKHYPSYHPYRIAGVFHMGLINQDLGKYEPAISSYHKTLQNLNLGPEPQPKLLAEAYSQLSRVHLLQKKYSTALKNIDQAIEIVTEQEDSSNLLDQISQDTEAQKKWIKQLQNEMSCIQYLDLRGRILMHMFDAQNKALQYGLEGLKTFELAAMIISQLRSQFPSPSSRATLREESSKIYQLGIELAATIYTKHGNREYLRRALMLSNASKAGLFRDHLRRDQIWHWSGLTEEEKTRLNRLQQKLQDPSSEATGERFEYYDFEQKLREKNRRYAFFSEHEHEFSTRKLEESIGATSLFIDFSWGEDMLVVLAIGDKKSKAYQLRLDDSIRLQLHLWSNQEWYLSDSIDFYYKLSYDLYSKLLKPILDSFPLKDKLILCLDGPLYHLSFASLLTKAHEIGKPPSWCIYQYALQYISSPFLLLNEPSDIKKPTKKHWMGFAPKFDNDENKAKTRDRLSPLRYNRKEVEELSRKQSGKAFIGDQASKSVFFNESKQAGILHLATHAIINNIEPLRSGLFFSDLEEDNFLAASELYKLKLPAELAVLSACQTGKGLVQTGEGAISLARAFRFAGVASVIATKWLADDRSIATVMNYFYEELDKGLEKSVALQNAQLRYLETSDPLLSHPYFWAGLSISGNDAPIINKKTISPRFLLVFILMLLAGISIYRLQSKKAA